MPPEASVSTLIALGVLVGAAAAAYWHAYRTESRTDRIIALLYHRLVPREEFEKFNPMEKNFSIPEDRFRAHLILLREQGYRGITLDAALDYVQHGRPLSGKSVLITFDDGCESVYSRALPILREFEFPATVFVTTDPNAWIFRHGADAQRRVTDDEIRALDRAGVTIGSHAVSHNALQAMEASAIEQELDGSKRELETVLGRPVRYFSVPLNWYGRNVRDAAIRVGYCAVCTSDNGVIHADSDVFHLRRLNVEGWLEASDLARHLKPRVIVERRVIGFFKRFPGQLLGPKIWLGLREQLFASPFAPLLSLKYLRRILLGATAGAVLVALVVIILLRR